MSRVNPFKGIYCPNCGSMDHAVLETRRDDGSIYRRRSCGKHQFWTAESICPAPDRAQQRVWTPLKQDRSNADKRAQRIEDAWKIVPTEVDASEEPS